VKGVLVHTLEASLSELLGSPGVIGAALVDAVTGLTYGAVGDSVTVGDGVELSDLANLITDRLNEAGAVGELESVVVTSTHRHQVIQVVPQRGDDLLLAAVLDRERTNLALAIRQVADRARDILV
jgi:hypothetical protein